MSTEIAEGLLDERLAALELARAWAPRVVSKLESHMRTADDEALFRINPCSFSAEKGISEAESVDLFLHASALGLFEMNWFLLCPLCSCVIDSFRTLRNLDSHCRCKTCHVDYHAALDDQIAVGFTVARDIRRIAYHDPQELPADDYIFRYRSAIEGLVPDGTPFTVIKRAIAKAFSYLEPGEETKLAFDVEAGALLGTSPDGDAAFFLPVDPALSPRERHYRIDCSEDACDTAGEPLARGRVRFDITNRGKKRLAFSILQLPPGIDKPPPLHFAPFLSGKRLLATQTFRDLFGSELASQGLNIKDITLLFTDLKGSTALYEQIGDLNAFSLVQQHFDRLREVTVRNEGAIIKTIGDAVMAVFPDPAHAVRAALAMRSEIGDVNRGGSDRALILKIGLHKGAAIAVTLNDRLDYFGQTVNIAARVQHLADADEIYLSEDVYASEGVSEQLRPFHVEAETARPRGLDQEIPVFRVAP